MFVIEWIRTIRKNILGVSNIWSCLINSFHILGQWLAWILENGQCVKLGEDPLIGGDDSYKIS